MDGLCSFGPTIERLGYIDLNLIFYDNTIESMARRFEVMRLVQNGKVVFLGFMKASDLFHDSIKVERWFQFKPTAYQRALRYQKVDKIARFLTSSKGIMPVSVLLSVRNLDSGGYHHSMGSSLGILEIPDNAEIYVVDGQHRIEGLRHAVNNYGASTLKDFPLPVLFLCPSLWKSHADPEVEEGKQFITINKTQTGVKGDLLDVFLLALDSVTKAKSPETTEGLPDDIVNIITPRVRALLVTLILNNFPAWRGLVSRPNQKRGNAIIGQKAMVDSLVDVVNSPTYKKKYPNVGPLAEILHHYWEAILDYYPNAARDQKRFWVQKRLGAYVFHRIFPDIDSLALKPKTKASYAVALKALKMKNESYWSQTGEARSLGTSYAAVATLTGEIWPPKK